MLSDDDDDDGVGCGADADAGAVIPVIDDGHHLAATMMSFAVAVAAAVATIDANEPSGCLCSH